MLIIPNCSLCSVHSVMHLPFCTELWQAVYIIRTESPGKKSKRRKKEEPVFSAGSATKQNKKYNSGKITAVRVVVCSVCVCLHGQKRKSNSRTQSRAENRKEEQSKAQ